MYFSIHKQHVNTMKLSNKLVDRNRRIKELLCCYDTETKIVFITTLKKLMFYYRKFIAPKLKISVTPHKKIGWQNFRVQLSNTENIRE